MNPGACNTGASLRFGPEIVIKRNHPKTEVALIPSHRFSENPASVSCISSNTDCGISYRALLTIDDHTFD